MDKQSTLHQLMGMRMNGIMNGITERDEDYQALLRAVDVYSDKLEALHLPAETMPAGSWSGQRTTVSVCG